MSEKRKWFDTWGRIRQTECVFIVWRTMRVESWIMEPMFVEGECWFVVIVWRASVNPSLTKQ